MTDAPYGPLVAAHGLADSHRALLAAVPDGARVLDVGCASGYLAAALSQRGCAVVGIESDADAAAQARAHADPVFVGDVAAVARWTALTDLPPFDVVVCGDVLEHVADPWTTVRLLADRLRPGGRMVVSVPNIAHWTGRRALARGRFDYVEWGLFDRTHLRFFTRDSARALLRQSGLALIDERPIPAPLPLQSRAPVLARLLPLALKAAPTLFALQFVLVGQRPER